MMRALAVFLIACSSKAPSPSAGSGTGSGTAIAQADAAIVVDAGPLLVDLFRAVPMTIEVSSRVANPKIKPEHLVDRDLATAWNSRTGELAGTWFEIPIPQGTVVHEVRMTVGHTGKGPKGEDYFTMNHRITRVGVELAGKRMVTIVLDPENRTLQRIALPVLARGGALRIVVDETLVGSKPKWKEVCVSELELWGTTDKVTPGAKPRVFETPSVTVERLCEGKITDEAYPECVVSMSAVEVPAPWTAVGVQDIVTSRSEHHGHLYSEGIDRSLVLVANSVAWTSDVINQSSYDAPGDGTKTEHSSLEIDEVRAIKQGGAVDLEIRYTVTGEATERFSIVCSADRTCTTPKPL